MNLSATATLVANYFNNRVHFIQTIVNFNSGKGTISFNAVGVNSRPSLCLVGACSDNNSVVVYQWDQSSTQIVLYGYNAKANYDLNGNIRLQILVIA